jgi:hypothetical protein
LNASGNAPSLLRGGCDFLTILARRRLNKNSRRTSDASLAERRSDDSRLICGGLSNRTAVSEPLRQTEHPFPEGFPMPHRLCPNCQQRGRFLEWSSTQAKVEYYVCDACGHVWYHANNRPDEAPVAVTVQRDERRA